MSALPAELLLGFFGARRQGKSAQVKQFLERAAWPRLLVWDYMNEYGAHAERVSSLADLRARARAARFQVRYVVPRPPGVDQRAARQVMLERFDTFCAIAYDAGDVLMVVEELQVVTTPSWAPPAWADCTGRGGHAGVRVLAIAQRPAKVDKDLFSNLSGASTCRLSFDDDIATMARVLRVAPARIAALPKYHYLVRDLEAGGDAVEGTVTFEKKKKTARARRGP